MEIINFIQQEDRSSVVELFGKEGFTVHELDTTGIDDMELFYKKLISVLPIGIPLSGKKHWDAFLDSVWEGIIIDNKIQKAVLIWNGADSMLKKSLSDFTTILQILTHLTSGLQNSNPKCQFTTVIVGNSPNYR